MNHDEALNGLDVKDILAGARPIFLERNNGREAGFMYMEAVVAGLFGVSPWSLRATAALTGVATVAATFGLARSWFGRRVGLLASALLAVAFWHIVLSRIGLRAILAPLCYITLFWILATAFRRPHWGRFALAGLVLGLSGYTYLSTRLLPPILVVVWGVLLLRDWRRGEAVRPRLAGVAVTVATAALVVLPEALYFWRHRSDFVERTGQVLVFSKHPAIQGAPITFGQSVQRTLGMFFWWGDPNWLHNIAALPMLDPVLALAFLGGCLLTGAAVARGPARQTSPLPAPSTWAGTSDQRIVDIGYDVWPELWLVVWILALMAGSALTQESPNYLHLTAIFPVVTILCAIGLVAATEALKTRLGRGWAAAFWRALPVLLALLVVGEGVRSADLFFRQWTVDPQVEKAYDVDIARAAHQAALLSLVPDDTFIQLDPAAPMQLLDPVTEGAHWMREYSTVLPLPAPGQPGLWIYFRQQQPLLPAYLPNAVLAAQGAATADRPGYRFYGLDAAALDAYRASFAPAGSTTTLGGTVQLVGVRMPPEGSVEPGQAITVELLWRVLRDQTANLGFSVHLTDRQGMTWAQSDRQGMMRSGWQAGQLLVSRHILTVPADTPPLSLQVEASASVLDPLHQPADVLRTLGAPHAIATVRVRPGPAGAVAPDGGATPVVPGLYLTGAELPTAAVTPGESAAVQLRWLRVGSLAPVWVRVDVIDVAGHVVASAGGSPGYGALAFASLPAGRVVADPRPLHFPAVLASGPLHVEVVATTPNGDAVLARRNVGTIHAVDRQHNFAVPASEYTDHAVFGGQIRLLGDDIAPTVAGGGQRLTVTLNWQAVQTPTQSYKVFVHLLGPDGRIVAQDDSEPDGGRLPTAGWLPGEVVADRHTIALPGAMAAGTYHLEVGWYDSATNKRLVAAPPVQADQLVLAQAIRVP